MRVIGGRWRGRTIQAPAGDAVRPTGDRVREAWMNIVQMELPGARVADLCAGSGALGIEALSRGAAFVTFVESSARSVAAIKRNLDTLGADPATWEILRQDAVAYAASLPERAVDLAFADPPYATAVGAALAAQWMAVPFARILGVEHAATARDIPGGDTRRYGTAAITFYRA
jgi:16S rRNA (guanine966-N2)-methyltransferase